MAAYATVVFDWDSTISAIEGIEEIASEHQERIVELTERAMRGEVPLEEVYGLRLAIARPGTSVVERLARRYLEELVPDAAGVIAALRGEGVDVRVISGGLRQAILPAAAELGIPAEAVAAVDVRFDEEGRYAGYDEASPMAYAGGKLRQLERWGPGLRRPVMLVGDGATDLEAKPAVDCFVAFAGVVERPKVVAGADVVIRARTLAPVLALALGDDAPEEPAARRLYEAGAALLRSEENR